MSDDTVDGDDIDMDTTDVAITLLPKRNDDTGRSAAVENGDYVAIDDADADIAIDMDTLDGLSLLQQHAIGLETHALSSIPMTNPIVTPLYTDLEGDRVMIGSNQELQEALTLFQNQGSLKVYANVMADKKHAMRLKEARHQACFGHVGCLAWCVFWLWFPKLNAKNE